MDMTQASKEQTGNGQSNGTGLATQGEQSTIDALTGAVAYSLDEIKVLDARATLKVMVERKRYLARAAGLLPWPDGTVKRTRK
jgi:hypothetical protein